MGSGAQYWSEGPCPGWSPVEEVDGVADKLVGEGDELSLLEGRQGGRHASQKRITGLVDCQKDIIRLLGGYSDRQTCSHWTAVLDVECGQVGVVLVSVQGRRRLPCLCLVVRR